MINVTDERYIKRQAKRELHHIKRNKRKNNPNNRVKVPVYDQVEINRRNVLLSITIARPDNMPVELHKSLLRERKALVNEHPKAKRRDIPVMSDKRSMPRTGKVITRTQYAYALGDKKLTEKQAIKLGVEKTFFVSGGKRKTGTYEIIGGKRITHVIAHNTQLFG